MFKWMTMAGVALSLLMPSAASAATEPPSGQITFRVNTVNGTGCPADTATIDAASDNTAFTVTYSAFDVSGGSYKNCQLGVTVHVPAGMTYSVYKVDNRGYAYLEKGASAKLQTTSYFTGDSWTMKASNKFTGLFDDAWQTTNYAENMTWASCNVDRALNINNTIRVSGPTTSSVSMSSTDASVSTVLHLKWKTCH